MAKFRTCAECASYPTLVWGITSMRLDKTPGNWKVDRDIALSLSISHTLHLATPTLGNGSEALNPAGFTVFNKFSQGGADLKDCSRSSIIFNQCRVLLRRINFEKIKRNGNKNATLNATSYLLTFFQSWYIFRKKSDWPFIASQTGVLPHIGQLWLF